jgi:hypothetical protein
MTMACDARQQWSQYDTEEESAEEADDQAEQMEGGIGIVYALAECGMMYREADTEEEDGVKTQGGALLATEEDFVKTQECERSAITCAAEDGECFCMTSSVVIFMIIPCCLCLHVSTRRVVQRGSCRSIRCTFLHLAFRILLFVAAGCNLFLRLHRRRHTSQTQASLFPRHRSHCLKKRQCLVLA